MKSLLLAQGNNYFPKLYSYGDKHIVREYIDGIELDKYLQSHSLTQELTLNIIGLYKAMYFIGYKRLDSALFHIYLTPSNTLKIIDTSKAMTKKRIYPSILIEGLNSLGCKTEFLYYVKILDSDLYNIWCSKK